MFSVDAVDNLYNYIRYPGNWEQTKNNILKILEMPNAKFLINCVVQNLNIMNLEGIIEFANKHKIFLNLNPTYDPAYMNFTNLSHEKLKIAHERLSKIQKLTLTQTGIYKEVEQFKQSIAKALVLNFDDALWQQFVDFITLKDQHRGKNVWDHLV